MLFTEQRFFVFFVVVFLVHWALRRNVDRKGWLLAASYFFYAAWDWRFLGLIFASTAVDFVAARRIAGSEVARVRRAWLVASLAANLGILGFFKYFNFFVESAAGALDALGVSGGLRTLPIVLPVGISFFTFQSMSYTIDCHRRKLQPSRSFVDFALYVGFFPQLVAGPIVRALQFLPQLDARRTFGQVDLRWCLVMILSGFVKKACVADRVAVAVDAVFDNDAAFGALSHWVAIALYSVQIYCDFSGYSDMAMGLAGLLGYRLAVNFDFPYFARSIREFWRRWHISLSTWLRDYLYVSLGGNRQSPARTIRNVFLTMLLGGLWHGAAWTFVAWGAFHGALLAVERVGAGRGRLRVPPILGIVYVNVAAWVGWVLFRSHDFEQALRYLGTMFGAVGAGAQQLDPIWAGALVAAAAAHALNGWLEGTTRLSRLEPRSFAFAYGLLVALALGAVETGHRPFIYFQF